jgi:hypothetical protein
MYMAIAAVGIPKSMTTVARPVIPSMTFLLFFRSLQRLALAGFEFVLGFRYEGGLRKVPLWPTPIAGYASKRMPAWGLLGSGLSGD